MYNTRPSHNKAQSHQQTPVVFHVFVFLVAKGLRRMRARMSVNFLCERSFANTGSTLRFINQMSRSSTAVLQPLERLILIAKSGVNRRNSVRRDVTLILQLL